MDDRTLILLRHSKSDWSTGADDLRRPLARRGLRQAPQAGRWLAANVGRIDLAVVSPAERTRATWELVSAELAVAPPRRYDERMYAASGRTLLAVVRELTDDLGTVVLVGHNPGLEDLVTTVTGRWVRLPTSAVAVLSVPGAWSSVGGSTAELRASGRPPAPSSGTG
ncbi:MAG: histidine phosphatase family protein [Nocardioides sp.]